MPRTRDANALIKDERKAEILKAATYLFAVYGNKVSIDQISEKAKCSHGLIYHYFLDVNHIYRTITKSEEHTKLIETIFTTKSDVVIDQIYQVICNYVSCLKKKDITTLSLLAIINKNELYSHLLKLCILGQKEGTVNPGKPEEICSIFKNQNNGVLLEILLQKSDKIVFPNPDNLFLIFYKKTTH